MRTFETQMALNNISVPVLSQEQKRFLKKLNAAKAAYFMVAKAMSAREKQWDEYRKTLTTNWECEFPELAKVEPEPYFSFTNLDVAVNVFEAAVKKILDFSSLYLLYAKLNVKDNTKYLQKPLKTVTLLLFGVTILLVSMRFVTLTFRYLHISLLLSRPMAIALFGLLFDLAKKFVLKTGAW